MEWMTGALLRRRRGGSVDLRVAMCGARFTPPETALIKARKDNRKRPICVKPWRCNGEDRCPFRQIGRVALALSGSSGSSVHELQILLLLPATHFMESTTNKQNISINHKQVLLMYVLAIINQRVLHKISQLLYGYKHQGETLSSRTVKLARIITEDTFL